MTRRLRPLVLAATACAVLAATAVPSAAATGARRDYERALAREQALAPTAAARAGQPGDVRKVVALYERVVARYPRSGYADNALWQGGALASDLFAHTGATADRQRAERLLKQLVAEYPSSSLRGRARARLRALSTPARPPSRPAPPARKAAGAPTEPRAPAPAEVAPVPSSPRIAARELPPVTVPGNRAAPEPPSPPVRLLDVRRADLPDVVRVTVELDGEANFQEQRLSNPPRVVFDLARVETPPNLRDATFTYGDAVVRALRLGQRDGATARVVLELDRAERYSVFTLYNPFRLVIDVSRPTALPSRGLPIVATSGVTPPPVPRPAPASARPVPATARADAQPPAIDGAEPAAPLAAGPPVPVGAPPTAAPSAPQANSNGGFSLSRQLGLGVARIVIDPGHGGRDPGALGKRLSEADLVLDVALRLEQLLLAQPGFEVVLTRRSDVFVPLEERTAVANRTGADLFLSIHANASRNGDARGIETYFLNFATSPDAEAVAARENSASGRTMNSLPDLVRAIALNNKLDESRDLARTVQQSMVRTLKPHNGHARDLGVKQAPFVVLIGAGMPSVLAEIAFVTHAREAQLLRTPAYRQRIAEGLFDAVSRYRRSLKSVDTVALQ